jgi:catechol 2,3-dioxygenase-like lactoylglutathione lyase family enzyme
MGFVKVLRLAHVNVRVDGLDAAVRFYAEVLGLEAAPRPPGERRGAWFRAGAGEIHVTEDPSPQPRSNRHFALDVDDLEDARRRLREAGVPIERDEADRFFVRDPAGNRIEIARGAPAR